MWLLESSHPLVSSRRIRQSSEDGERGGGGDLGGWRTEGWQTWDGGRETRRQEDGRQGAEDNWVVDGVEKGEGGGRMLFHSGDGHKRTMSPTFLRGAANPACPFSRDYSYNDTIFIRMCVACC